MAIIKPPRLSTVSLVELCAMFTLRYVCDLFFLGFFATMETIITDWLQVEGGSNPKRKRAELLSLERLPLN